MVLSCVVWVLVKCGECFCKKIVIILVEFEVMLVICDDFLEGICDCVMFCFGFSSGGCWCSEIVVVDMCDLCKVGEGGYIYWLEYLKM